MSVSPPGQGAGGASNTGIITVLQQLVTGQAAILQALKALATPLGVFTSGLWTPTLMFGGGSVGITYSVQKGIFSIVGNVVTCSFSITLTSVGSSTGNATFTGLPSAGGSGLGSSGVVSVYSGMSGISGGIAINASGGASAVLLSNSASAAVNLTNSNFSNTTSLSGLFTYFN